VDAMRGGLVNQSHFGLPMDFAVMFTTMILLSGFLLTVSKG